MPELPEVETVRVGLEPVLRGRRFVRVEQRRANLRFPLPERFAERLTGRRVKRLGRRAKYILLYLDRGEVLAVHLGMTGRFSVRLPGTPLPAMPEACLRHDGERVTAEPCLRHEVRGGSSSTSACSAPTLTLSPRSGERGISSASSRMSMDTTPSTTTWCSRCRAGRSSPTTMRAASAT